MVDDLIADVEALFDMLARASADGFQAKHRQALIRATIRGTAAMLEGFVVDCKTFCLQAHKECLDAGRQTKYSRAEVALLQEEPQVGFSLDKHGVASEVSRPVPLRFRDNLRFAAAMLCREAGISLSLDADPGWIAVMGLIEVRDRLAHPRVLADIEVDSESLRLVYGALGWVVGLWTRVNVAWQDPQ